MGGWGRDESGLRAWGCVRNEWSALGSRHTVVTVGACVYTRTHARRDQRTTSRRRHKGRNTQALCMHTHRSILAQSRDKGSHEGRRLAGGHSSGTIQDPPLTPPPSLLPFLFFRKLLKAWQPHHWGLTIKRANQGMGKVSQWRPSVWEVPFCNQHWTPLGQGPHQDHSRLPHP